jgi:hypothetical protein
MFTLRCRQPDFVASVSYYPRRLIIFVVVIAIIIASVVVTDDNFIAGVMELMKIRN